MSNQAFKTVDYNQEAIYNFANKQAVELNFNPRDDIEKIVKDLGGTLEYVDHDRYQETEDGSIVVKGLNEFDIYVSKNNGYHRKRFTIAHELGHYMLHSKFGRIKGKAQRFPSIQEYSQIEIEANWFAAGFLMPISEFKNKCENGLLNNAIYFGVSLETAEYRYRTYSNKNF